MTDFRHETKSLNKLEKLKSTMPKIPEIMDKEQFLNSAVLIPIVIIDETHYLLFEKRSANIKQGGEICFPGGRIEKKR